ncbi:MAG TPA: RNA polymerase sigma factor [Candidatus Limnocylindrales bacterium]
MTDRELRDRAADQAYRDHAPDVYRVAYGILRDPDEALDATHDTFARAWERWEQYDSQRPLRAWLHGIVVHLALDQLRRRRVRRLAIPAIGRSPIGTVGTGSAPDPSSDVVRRQVVEEALATLQPRARAALVLRHYYGYDYDQIGLFLGTGSGTVGSILSRAHASLRERLGPVEPVDPMPATATPARRPVERPAEPPEVLP